MAQATESRRKRLIQGALIITILIFQFVASIIVVNLLGIRKSILNFQNLTFGNKLVIAGAYVSREAVILVICVLAAMFIFRQPMGRALRDLGLAGNIKTGWLVGLVASLPMLIILSVVGHATLNTNHLLFGVLVFSIVPAFAEEVVYRGFTFGLMYRRVRVGFWLSIIFPTIFFAVGHLYQAHGIWSAVGILAVTASGSVWFAWLYVRWDYNLWVPISMHLLMDAWATMFVIDNASGSAALGSAASNAARALTILLSIVLTLWHCGWDFRKALFTRPFEPPLIAKASGSMSA